MCGSCFESRVQPEDVPKVVDLFAEAEGCQHPNKLYTGALYDGPGGGKDWLYYTCRDCKTKWREEPPEEPKPCTCGPDEGCGDPCTPVEEPPLTPEIDRLAAELEQARVEREELHGELGLAPGQLHSAALSAVRGKHATIRELAERTEPPLTSEEEEEAPEDLTLPPPEGPEYDRCVCGATRAQHVNAEGSCYSDDCECMQFQARDALRPVEEKPPPQPDRRPPYAVAYSVQGHLFEVALPGDASVKAVDGALVIQHHLGPVLGIVQVLPVINEESNGST
jgi:hypothetical protein